MGFKREQPRPPAPTAAEQGWSQHNRAAQKSCLGCLVKGQLVTTCSFPLLTSPGWLQTVVRHSPGVWHRAEGTPRKGGLKWGPRAMWGAFWGESRGGGWEISLQKSEQQIQVEILEATSTMPRGFWLRRNILSAGDLHQRLLPDSPTHTRVTGIKKQNQSGKKATRTPVAPTYFQPCCVCFCGLSAELFNEGLAAQG